MEATIKLALNLMLGLATIGCFGGITKDEARRIAVDFAKLPFVEAPIQLIARVDQVAIKLLPAAVKVDSREVFASEFFPSNLTCVLRDARKCSKQHRRRGAIS